MSAALVFPGMGPVAFADVGKFMVLDPRARELVALADDVLGYSLVGRLREGGTDYSEVAQVAFLVNCLASAQWATDVLGIEPTVCTGPSFGGKTAVAWTGALSVAATVRATAEMARCAQAYFAEDHRDVVTMSFARTPQERLDEVLAGFAADGHWYDIACQVDRDFHMVSLREGAAEELKARIRAAGGMTLYTMRPPMHCAAFAGLRQRVEREVVDSLIFADPSVPIVSDLDASLIETADGARRLLLDGFVRRMYWPAVVEALSGRGVRTVCVAGPDSLFGRVRVTTDAFDVVAANPRRAMTPRPRTAVT